MARVSRERAAALEVLREVRRGRRLDRALDSALQGLSADEGPWVHAATYGVVRLRGRLDHLLDRALHSGSDSVSPLLLDILRLGGYQLLYMDGVPDYAAISQSVEQAKKVVGPRVSGLVNAVLRSVQRDSLKEGDRSPDHDALHARGEPGVPAVGGADPALFPDPAKDPLAYLATWGSHPRWLAERWMERYGREGAFALVEANNRIPVLSVRPVGLSPGAALERLEEAGIGARPVGRGTRCLWIDEGVAPGAVLRTIPSVVQDPGASLVVEYASPEPGARIADLCAAPGGKALALAGSASWVLAADLSPRRLALLGPAVERLGSVVPPVYRVVARGEIPPIAEADLVLVDVPCTGTGTFRRHPDGKWRLEPGDPARLAEVQARILQGASGSVRPGGLLIYSTCTLEPEENEEVVSRFIARSDQFRIEAPSGPSGAVEDFVDEAGFLRVLPHETGFDGAFAARMRRLP